VRPIVEAGLAEMVSDTHQLTSEVWLESTSGHTPGHVSVCIESVGERALITGDMTHHPIQFAHPDLASSADWRQDISSATRKDAYGRPASHWNSLCWTNSWLHSQRRRDLPI
ncbi:MAG: MBL fold metallo-hydrolase, partial [Acidimicrobiales bacterium]